MRFHLPSPIPKWIKFLGAAVIAVSFAVLVGWGIVEAQRRGRSERFQALAVHHAWLSRDARGWSDEITADRRCIRREWPTPLSLYHDRLKEKYERAALYPWLPVESDPPKPK
jgi:hypothetical protein